MAPISYYYLISLALWSGILYCLINLVCVKFKGKTTFGMPYKKGSAEYNQVLKIASKKNFAIVTFILVVLSANLAYSIFIALKYGTSEAYIPLFVGVPVFFAFLTLYMNAWNRHAWDVYGPQMKRKINKNDS